MNSRFRPDWRINVRLQGLRVVPVHWRTVGCFFHVLLNLFELPKILHIFTHLPRALSSRSSLVGITAISPGDLLLIVIEGSARSRSSWKRLHKFMVILHKPSFALGFFFDVQCLRSLARPMAGLLAELVEVNLMDVVM